DLALRACQFGERLQACLGAARLWADAAGEGGIADVIEHAGRFGAELDDSAAVIAVGDRPAAERGIGLEQRAFADDLGGVAGPARGLQRGNEGVPPVAQALAVIWRGDLTPVADGGLDHGAARIHRRAGGEGEAEGQKRSSSHRRCEGSEAIQRRNRLGVLGGKRAVESQYAEWKGPPGECDRKNESASRLRFRRCLPSIAASGRGPRGMGTRYSS